MDQRFATLLSTEETRHLYEMMRVLDSALGDRPWFLYAGALLGYCLTGELLPWDDDIDILLPGISGISAPPFTVRQTRFTTDPLDVSAKCFDPSRPPIDGHPYSFPFIDLALCYEDGNAIAHRSVYGGVNRFPRDAIFPLRRARFGPVEVNIPNDPERVLTIRYGTEWRKTASPPQWDHRRERPAGWPMDRVSLADLLKVSIVIPCKGRLSHLKDLLPQAVRQAAEVIVCDYNCPDGTADWVGREYPDVKVVRCDVGPNDWNLNHCRNEGIKAATSPIILVLDADTLMDPDCVARNFALLGPRTFGSDMGNAIFWRSDCFSVGGYNEMLRFGWGADDGEFYLRLMQAGIRPFNLTGTRRQQHGDDLRGRYQSISIHDSVQLNLQVRDHRGL